MRRILMKIGLGYRRELIPWLSDGRAAINCLELTAEHFYDAPQRSIQFANWRRSFVRPLSCFVHGLGLSLGTPGALGQARLRQFSEVATACQAEWVSEHVAFTRTGEGDLGHLNPVPPTYESVKIMADHALELSGACGRPLLLENITSHVRLQGELSETDYLNELCSRGRCGILLDITNLFVNSRNHGFDATEWVHQLEPANIQQLHLVGYSRRGSRFIDDHSKDIQPELLELARAVIDYAPVKAIILERDADIPAGSGMDAELAKLESLCGAN
jgi:uncharacterized protein